MSIVDRISRDIYIMRKNREKIDYTSGTNLIPIEFKVKDWAIPADATAAVYVRKPSGAIVYNNCTVDELNNTVTLQPTLQMFAEAGTLPAQIQFVSDGSIVNTYKMEFVIEDKVVSDEAVESTNEFSQFASILSSTQTLTEAVVADYVEQHGLTTGATTTQANQIATNTTTANQAAADIAALQQTVSALSSTVSSLADTVAAMSASVTTMSETVTGMSSTVTSLQSDMDDLNEGIESYDTADL